MRIPLARAGSDFAGNFDHLSEREPFEPKSSQRSPRFLMSGKIIVLFEATLLERSEREQEVIFHGESGLLPATLDGVEPNVRSPPGFGSENVLDGNFETDYLVFVQGVSFDVTVDGDVTAIAIVATAGCFAGDCTGFENDLTHGRNVFQTR